MNAHQRRTYRRRVKKDHRFWPLGTTVRVKPGHHSPEAVGEIGHVFKHGYPCKSGVNCIVDFFSPIYDTTYGGSRYAHYVDFQHLEVINKLAVRA
jgi:hypothetical protein